MPTADKKVGLEGQFMQWKVFLWILRGYPWSREKLLYVTVFSICANFWPFFSIFYLQTLNSHKLNLNKHVENDSLQRVKEQRSLEHFCGRRIRQKRDFWGIFKKFSSLMSPLWMTPQKMKSQHSRTHFSCSFEKYSFFWRSTLKNCCFH